MNISSWQSLSFKLIAPILLLVLSFSANAELVIQNAMYNASTGMLHIKGKITGNASEKVYVLNASSNLYVGSADTYSNNRQFQADFTMTSADVVPCSVKVQTNAPVSIRRGMRAAPSGDFDVAEVRFSGDTCLR